MVSRKVVFASPDEVLGRELAALAEALVPFSQTTDLNLVPFLMLDHDVDCLVIDVRTQQYPEQSLTRLVEKVQQAHSATRMHLLVENPAPVWIGSFHGRDGIACDFGPHTPERLLEQVLADATPNNPAPQLPVIRTQQAPLDAGGAAFGEVIFEGATRRFETRSPELKRMLEDLMVAAGHDVTILLIGETGSGKTFLSNLIHEASPRRNEPFLHVACGALPRELIESELFGHTKGSFTSAHADKDGKFVAARRGTILLDEIDVLGPEQQVKLLRVIETGEFEPVGSNQTLQSRARLVVASNLELQPLVEQARFRPDLYYRLNMMKFEIPPLRKRKVDIIPMAKKFIQRFQEKHSIPVHRIEDSVLEALLAYPWPGNVRELEHVMQRAVIYCRDGVLTRDQLPSHLLSGQAGPVNDPSVQLTTIPTSLEQSLERQVAVTEKEIIEQTLFKNNFNRTRTARDLGISRVTLYNKMKKYEMLKS